MYTKLFQSVLSKTNSRIPIWFLRQAGRYMPEYMEIRSVLSNFLELCYDSDKASMVTLQPIERFDLDAAIVFSDILVLPHCLGWDVSFKAGEGPVLKRLENEKDLENFGKKISSSINEVYETVSKVRRKLSVEKDLIGFAGSPWTVASYMIEGRGKHDFSYSRAFAFSNRKLCQLLIDKLTYATITYLSNQIKAGADAVMLFDSWSGVLSGEEYQDFVINPTARIVEGLKADFPDIPIIGFPRGSGYNYEKYIEQTKIDILHVDQFIPLEIMKKWQEKIIVQGNLDPTILLSNRDTIIKKVDNIFSILADKNFVFNLGHGILPNTDPNMVEFLVKYVREKNN